ncbi:hypothetical protein Godav_014302 [Gossypium davidsonii]|uniref:Uncharacterized protein n=2 Tax=Gossypium TaxID=3633 RepID=A0A7J8RJC6_GOSDV|nr:hypothetical protein [Gossypium davidsonii]
MSQGTCSLTLVMDPYGISQAVKVLDSMSEEVPEAISQYRERFQRFGVIISQYFAIVLEKVSRMAIDLIIPDDRAINGTHIIAILPPNKQIPYIAK